MTRGRACALLCGLVLGWATDVSAQSSAGGSAAGAKESIEVLVAGDDRRGFVSALRIQTGGFASITSIDALEGATPRARRAAVQALLAGEGARAVLWFESARGDDRRALYLIGRGPAGVRTEIFASNESSFDDDRVLALKVRLVLDALAAGQPSPRGAVDAPIDDAVSDPDPPLEPEPAAVTAPPRSRWRLDPRWTWLEGRAILALPAGAPDLQAALGAAVGAGWRVPFGYIEGYGAVAAATTQTQSDANGQVSAWELAAAAGARAGVERGAWRLGGAAELGLRLAFASAESVAGTTGDGVSYIPTLLALGEAMWSPFASREPGWRLRLAVGLEVSALRQRFAINGREVLDLGRARPVAQLGVVFLLP